ncbi:hypothetical protein MSG28_012750 [Choristoneura fumiferana]|uniref:Uncharacterized protein n=1 Tax=Choristoneura fumiferana TaxID=7141 RepID=A0ACC0JI01_CHOFU|nr:hypothetical protein MSG28_012750 [Choristoneura fumiferana]
MIPESASKVILPQETNESNANNIVKTIVKKPTIHAVKELTDDDFKNFRAKKISKKSEHRAHAQYDEKTGELIGGDHPCHRECMEGEEPMICYYMFHLEWYQTMSKACYDCPFNETDCQRLDCIPADGMSRALNVINRKMPGPAIEVCQHDRVIVDVENDLMTEGTTVHWHGQHQRGTPFMDGTPYVTQCPIPPESTFRYQFNASHDGTHFWHSHSGMQRADGAAGAFIIRRPKSQDPHGALYDYDRSEHVMIVTDWIHELSVAMFTDHHHSKGDNKPPTLLINGVGRFKIFNGTKPFYMRTARFNVEQGYKYRFRVINAEFLNCPIEMSVDGHNITVISSDGYDLEPITDTNKYLGDRALLGLKLDNKRCPRDKTKLDRFVIPENPHIPNFIVIVGAVSEIPEILYTIQELSVLSAFGKTIIAKKNAPQETWQKVIELYSHRLAQYLQNRTTRHTEFMKDVSDLCFGFTTDISDATDMEVDDLKATDIPPDGLATLLKDQIIVGGESPLVTTKRKTKRWQASHYIDSESCGQPVHASGELSFIVTF